MTFGPPPPTSVVSTDVICVCPPSQTKAKAVERQRIAAKAAELEGLLDVPLTSMGFSGKYPTKTGKLEMPDQFSGECRF